jgi:hypothetical protein
MSSNHQKQEVPRILKCAQRVATAAVDSSWHEIWWMSMFCLSVFPAEWLQCKRRRAEFHGFYKAQVSPHAFSPKLLNGFWLNLESMYLIKLLRELIFLIALNIMLKQYSERLLTIFLKTGHATNNRTWLKIEKGYCFYLKHFSVW